MNQRPRNSRVPLIHMTFQVYRLAGPWLRSRGGEGFADFFRRCRPDDAGDFLAVAQGDEGRPEFDAEGSAEWPAGTILDLDVGEIADKLKTIRRYSKLPVGVGFGIDGPQRAAQVAAVADAVIVGSAIVRRIEECASEPERVLNEVPAFLATLRAAMDTDQHRNQSSGAKP